MPLNKETTPINLTPNSVGLEFLNLYNFVMNGQSPNLTLLTEQGYLRFAADYRILIEVISLQLQRLKTERKKKGEKAKGKRKSE